MTRSTWILLVLALLAGACGSTVPAESNADAAPDEISTDLSDADLTDADEADQESPVDDADASASPDVVRNYVFGHSLIVHAPPTMPAGPDETTVPHWLGRLASASGVDYSVDGQYGFLRSHAANPPQPQWGFTEVPGAWDIDAGLSFGDADFTTILLTPANFIQGLPATEPFEDDPGGPSPVDATLEIIDRAVADEPGVEILIYENWPDLAGTVGDFPPSADALAEYHASTSGEFHQWWLDYHDALRTARPDVEIRLVPAGSAIADLLTREPWSSIDVTDLYEDDAPHGRPTIYLLAAAATAAAMFGPDVPVDVELSDSIHPTVRDAWPEVVATIRAHLESVVDTDGASRVW